MPAFLEKLKRLCANCPPHIGGWTVEGTQFEVKSKDFEVLLKDYFKGSLKTFVRQLHFYGFKKSETLKGYWTFSHPKFTRDNPKGILEIRRKSKKATSTFVTHEELKNWKTEMVQFRDSICKQMAQLQHSISKFSQMLESTPTVDSSAFLSNQPLLGAGKRKFGVASSSSSTEESTEQSTYEGNSSVKRVKTEPLWQGRSGTEELDNIFNEFPMPFLDMPGFNYDFQ